MILKQFAVDIANSFTKWNLWRGGGGGSTTLAELEDVEIINPQHGDTLTYNAIINKWTNKEIGRYFIIDDTLYMYGEGISIVGNTLIIDDTNCYIDERTVYLYD